MNPFAFDIPQPAIAALAVKATALIGLAAVALLLARRYSAATRHWLITLAICGLLALPFMSGALPSWTLVKFQSVPAVLGSSTALIENTSQDGETAVEAGLAPSTGTYAPAPSSRSITAWQAAVLLYVGIAFVLFVRLAFQFGAARHLVHRSETLVGASWEALLREGRSALEITRPVRLLRGGPDTMPMATGAWNAAVVLPTVADEWTEDRQRAVLLHELAHVARRDCLTQLLGGIACALYWPHPGVWWLARRLRVERELACDDLVLRAGTPAMDYAGHLLDVAYTLGGARTNALAVGMARRSQLEGRMLAVLDAARNRAMPGRRLRLMMAAGALVALVPLAVATVSSEPLTLDADVEVSAHPASRDEAALPATINQPSETKAELKPAPWARAFDELAAQASNLVRGSGSWTISPSRALGEVHLEMREGRSQSGRTMKLAALEGLTEAQLTTGGPVTFVLRRDAGTFTFEGTARDGHGGGTFSFTANESFAGELEKRGVGRPTAEQQYEMARHDVGLALVDELQRRGYARPTAADLVKAGHHGVHVEYVREMAELGYALGTLEPLIKLRDHGVTPGFVRGLASHGFTKIPADEVRRVRDHGVTPEFIGELKSLGFGNLSLAEIVRVRDHGVTPQYISAMRELGYNGESIQSLVKARDHGVTPEFVKGLGDLGYTKLALAEVIKTRDHGVTPAFIRELGEAGYTKLALQDVIKTRDHGVTPAYAREMKALGYDNIPLDELIRLRNHGVTAERVKRANERAGTKLPLDMLRSLNY